MACRIIGIVLFILSIPILPAEEDLSRVATQLIEDINQFRESQGLGSLALENLLTEVSLDYAAVLMDQKIIVHQSDLWGSPMDRYRARGGTAIRIGETLGTLSPQGDWDRIITLWQQSPEHLKVLMDPQWSALGVGLCREGSNRVVVALFSTSMLLQEVSPQEWLTPDQPVFIKDPLSKETIWVPPASLIDLNLYRKAGDYRLLEIRNESQKLRNRIMLEPVNPNEDVE